ncbi:MAG: DUF3748 domain-containing protein [Bacteroidetes bacterium]|nr:DUF3748 domain-containing protein [Bacteroidota bacterium]
MKEKQISFSPKNHDLDNNDNFSPNGKFLCYDTRGTVYNTDLANCKSIEKIEIATGEETVLWSPEYVTGDKAAPGVAAVSWHPSEDKVIFIHGPLLEEVDERGFYGIRNRTGVEVSADGKGTITKVDRRDVSVHRPTISGAQRGGTHRHEYTRDGKRIGFTYDDFLQQNYDRTIGYMEANESAPEGYTNYFAVLLKPAEKGKSKPGEIEKAYGDSWVDSNGKMRAFIGDVRATNGIDYETELFVAEIPDSVDIKTSFSGTKDEYPSPPKGVVIWQLTHRGWVGGIVRGSFDGKRIAYFAKDKAEVKQIFVIATDGSDLSNDKAKRPKQLTSFDADVSVLRWHPSNDWIFSIVDGNVAGTVAKPGENFGKSVLLTNDEQKRDDLVVSPDGNQLAYTIFTAVNDKPGTTADKEFRQIFVLDLDWEKIKTGFTKVEL